MSAKSNSGKIVAVILIILIGAAAGYGYFKQSTALTDEPAADAKTANPAANATLLDAKPNDIIIGDNNALITIVEYNSLSCTHCAHFHETVLPDLQKEFITPGKVKLVLRHFPLNAPALKASELIECAGSNGGDRANFMKVLFSMQPKWAFDDNYLKNLKQIAGVGGVDSAAFDSCMDDKSLEASLVSSRQEAQDKLGVDGTPAFFINGKKYDGDRTIEGFRKAIKEANPSESDASEPAAAPAPKRVTPKESSAHGEPAEGVTDENSSSSEDK